MNRYTRGNQSLLRTVRQPATVVSAAVLSSAILAVAWWLWPFHPHRELSELSLLIGGLLGLSFAYWRCHTADENRRQEQYRIASELLDMKKSHYAARVAGAATLTDLLKEDPDQYDVRIMKTFEAFLEFPPQFGGSVPGTNGIHPTGTVDYMSRDTEEVVRTISTRTKRQRKRYRIALRHFAPFTVTEDGNVTPNFQHADYKTWMAVEGEPPTY